MLGKDAKSLRFTFYQIQNDCSLVAATVDGVSYAELYGSLENIQISSKLTAENLSPMNSSASNPVPNEIGFSVKADVLMGARGSSSGSNILRYYQTVAYKGLDPFSFVIKITQVSGRDPLEQDTTAFYGRIMSWQEDISKPKVSGTIEIESIDVRDSTINSGAYPVLMGDISVRT